MTVVYETTYSPGILYFMGNPTLKSYFTLPIFLLSYPQWRGELETENWDWGHPILTWVNFPMSQPGTAPAWEAKL